MSRWLLMLVTWVMFFSALQLMSSYKMPLRTRIGVLALVSGAIVIMWSFA